jgi:transposase InsO family protein
MWNGRATGPVLPFTKWRRPHPKTSDGKGQGDWPNLLEDENLKVEAPGQVWGADITYIAVPGGFAYLACILDVFLRKMVGSSLSKRIDAKLTLAALRQALATRPPRRRLDSSFGPRLSVPLRVARQARAGRRRKSQLLTRPRPRTTPSWNRSSRR